MKKTSVLLGVLFCVGMVLFIARTRFSGAKTGAQLSSALSAAATKKALQDSDQDGLKDWEEVLFATNPHNPDTDGDGASDLEEVKTNRDPVKPGPDDARPISTTTPMVDPATPPETNLTRLLAERLGERLIIPLARNPEAKPDPSITGERLIDDIVAAAREQNKVFSLSDISISSAAGRSAIIAYQKTSDAIFNAASRKLGKVSAPEIAAQAFQNDDFSTLSLLASHEQILAKLIRNLKQLSVPRVVAPLHLARLNAVLLQQQGVEKMQNAETDPVGALIGIREYIDATKNLSELSARFIQVLSP